MKNKNIKCPNCKNEFYESDWDKYERRSMEIGEIKKVTCESCNNTFNAKLKYGGSSNFMLRYFVTFKKEKY